MACFESLSEQRWNARKITNSMIQPIQPIQKSKKKTWSIFAIRVGSLTIDTPNNKTMLRKYTDRMMLHTEAVNSNERPNLIKATVEAFWLKCGNNNWTNQHNRPLNEWKQNKPLNFDEANNAENNKQWLFEKKEKRRDKKKDAVDKRPSPKECAQAQDQSMICSEQRASSNAIAEQRAVIEAIGVPHTHDWIHRHDDQFNRSSFRFFAINWMCGQLTTTSSSSNDQQLIL